MISICPLPNPSIDRFDQPCPDLDLISTNPLLLIKALLFLIALLQCLSVKNLYAGSMQ
nr:hypothetical protein Q903MT_gene3319 [Picea sitchensis]